MPDDRGLSKCFIGVASDVSLPLLDSLFFGLLLRVDWGTCKVRYGSLPEEVIGPLEAAAAYKAAGGSWEEYT